MCHNAGPCSYPGLSKLSCLVCYAVIIIWSPPKNTSSCHNVIFCSHLFFCRSYTPYYLLFEQDNMNSNKWIWICRSPVLLLWAFSLQGTLQDILALQRENLRSMYFTVGEHSICRVGQVRTRDSVLRQSAGQSALPTWTGAVCSPRAVVGPAELSAGHTVVQGQRPQTGPQKWILCENGQVLEGNITRFRI